MNALHSPKLLPAADYARDVAKKIAKARYRVAMIATTFRANDERSQAIVDELVRAAERGVDVCICADTFTYIEPKEFILRAPKRQPVRAMQALKLERRIKRAGGSFHWLGRKANTLFAGRTHSKWTVIDDIAYVGGGVNMDDESFSNVDYMFRFSDQALADRLIQEQQHIYRADRGGGAARNHSAPVSKSTTILFDNGLPTNSLIYKRARALAKQAEHIALVSQYCPTGALNRTLKRKQAVLYFNHWRTASSLNKLLIRLGMMTARQKTLYNHDRYLHAKFLIAIMPDGSKAAITGSHNFMYGSGLVGTREVALETYDPHLIRQLETFRRRYVE